MCGNKIVPPTVTYGQTLHRQHVVGYLVRLDFVLRLVSHGSLSIYKYF